MEKIYEQMWKSIKKLVTFFIMFFLIISSFLGYKFGKILEEKKQLKSKSPETIIVERDVSPIPYDDLGIYTISHYCDCPICTGTQKGSRTASGTKPKEGRTIACDGKTLKMGDIVYISGYGVYICEDLGGKIKQNKIDIYCNSHNEALKKGIKKAKVYKL